MNYLRVALFCVSGLFVVVAASVSAQGPRNSAVDEEAYNQWKKALGTNAATDPKDLKLVDGFKVELLRSAAADEGSWVSMAFDPKGRLVIAREDKGLLRMTLPTQQPDKSSDGKTNGESAIQVETINDELLECRGLLFAYDSLYVNANNSKGMFRLRDLDGDDKFDEVKLLQATPGGVGHGRNDLVLGPDGFIYSIHGDDVFLPEDRAQVESPFRNAAEDRLLPCAWDRTLFDGYVKLPAGHVVRTDRDGNGWEVVCGGMRNPFGIAFNRDGEMFTYDADMEWDVGALWYRPTRVLHLVSGGDYGWRRGTRKWPAWYPDSLPAVADIGLGSPTAVKFGTGSKFPPRYQEALYILDWAYGRIIAIHMQTSGATYVGKTETFVEGTPLNVTDIDFGPDGAMYVITGGRRTQSGLYRVTYAKGANEADSLAASASPAEAEKARAIRRSLEQFHNRVDASAVETAWPYLSHTDRWLRWAARVAIERQPLEQWQTRAFEETNADAVVGALLALARTAPGELAETIFSKVKSYDWANSTDEQKLGMLRVAITYLSRTAPPTIADQQRWLKWAEARFPDRSGKVNQLLCEMLVSLDSPHVVAKTIPLLAAAETQEEKLNYLFLLRQQQTGWSVPHRKTYFEWLREASHFRGGRDMPRFLKNIKDDTINSMTETERAELADVLAKLEVEPEVPTSLPPRKFVKDWTLDELLPAVASSKHQPNVEHGRELFEATLCRRCHRFGDAGGVLGPDLTSVARRFNQRDLLLSILNPSQAIDEKYRNTTFFKHDGTVVAGQMIGEDDKGVVVAVDPLNSASVVSVPRDSIESEIPSPISPMPAGLLSTLTAEEILDLLAYLTHGWK